MQTMAIEKPEALTTSGIARQVAFWGREGRLGEPVHALHLTADDAALLLNLCLTSTLPFGEREEHLLDRLGYLYRLFSASNTIAPAGDL